MKIKYRFCTKKYRGAWENLENNIKYILAIENVDNFPKIVEEYVIMEDNFFENLKEKLFWIYGNATIHLYSEEGLKLQREVYQHEESVSNLLKKVYYNLINLIK